MYDKSLENPHTTAALLTLGGVRTVIINQYASNPETNYILMENIVRRMIKSKESPGKAVHYFRKQLSLSRPPSAEGTKSKTAKNETSPQDPFNSAFYTFHNPIVYGIP